MHVRVNAATSVDGKLASRRRTQLHISGAEDFDRVARLRADSDAVMVGVGTVLADDPHLVLDDPDLVAEREARGDPPQPTRVVADSRGRTPLDARVLDDDAPTVLLVSERASDERVAALESEGASVVRAGERRVDLTAALDELEDTGIGNCMVEGGGELVFSLFEADLVDALSVYVGSMVVGGRDAPTLVDGEGFVGEYPSLDLRDVERVGEGVVLRYDC